MKQLKQVYETEKWGFSRKKTCSWGGAFSVSRTSRLVILKANIWNCWRCWIRRIGTIFGTFWIHVLKMYWVNEAQRQTRLEDRLLQDVYAVLRGWVSDDTHAPSPWTRFSLRVWCPPKHIEPCLYQGDQLSLSATCRWILVPRMGWCAEGCAEVNACSPSECISIYNVMHTVTWCNQTLM